MPTLQSERLTIRPFRASNIDGAYLGWLSDPLVTRFSNQRYLHHSEASAKAYLENFAKGPSLFLSLLLRAGDRPIGTMTAHVSTHHATADLGLLIGDSGSWGQGYGLEAWSCVMQWLLQHGNVRKVTAGAAAPNIGMVTIMRRSGMQQEGLRRAQEIIEGAEADILLFGRLRDA